MNDTLTLHGTYILEGIDPVTKDVLWRQETPNLVTIAGKIMVVRMLIDETGYDTGLTYIGLGTGTGTPVATDTQLGNEQNREVITRKEDVGSGGGSFITYFTAANLPTSIAEVGAFGHGASGVAGSGTLFSRALLAVSDTQGEDLLVTYVLTVG